MAEEKNPDPAKLFVGMLSNDIKVMEAAEKELEKLFGEINFSSEIIKFTWTDFYNEEMGENLLRKFVAFQPLRDPLFLADAKKATNRLEKLFKRDLEDRFARKINLDPGLVELSKLTLASVKDRPHRIYIGQNIYAEITLYYKKKTFRPWEWSYADYSSPEYIALFNRLRALYFDELKLLKDRGGHSCFLEKESK